jgi:hypothetical protein
MIDPHESGPRAHLPPERLAVLGLLTPLFFGMVAGIFFFLPAPVAAPAACIATVF